MTSLDRWLSRLQLSPRSQRVLTEAALDWRHEVTTAKTMGDRILRHARASIGFGRACVSVGVDALIVPMAWPWSLRILASTALIACLNWQRLQGMVASAHGDPTRVLITVWPQWVSFMPFALAVAVLVGPRRSPSPAAGMTAFAAVSALAFMWCWPPLVTATALIDGRRLFGAVSIPPSFGWFTTLFTLGLVLLADRLRVAEYRLRVTGISLVQLALAVLAAGPLQQGVRAAGLPAGVGRSAVTVLLLGAPLLLWIRLVLRQERRQVTV